MKTMKKIFYVLALATVACLSACGSKTTDSVCAEGCDSVSCDSVVVADSVVLDSVDAEAAEPEVL